MYLNKTKIFSLFILLFICKFSFATHYRAGEILYEYIGPQTFQVTI